MGIKQIRLFLLLISFMLSCSPADDSYEDPMNRYSDVFAPTIVGCSPGANASDVAVSASVSVTFIEEMDPDTINSSVFSIKDGTSDVSGTVSYSDKVLTFAPSNSLPDGTSLTAVVSAVVKDTAGNSMAENYSWSFETTQIRLIPDTGQTQSYTDTFGEDSDYSMNPPSYTDNNNGTITDNVTELVWQQTVDNTQRTWSDANSYCENLELAGITDWRLPATKELLGLLMLNRAAGIDDAFSDVESSWSSNGTDNGDNYYHWVSFNNFDIDRSPDTTEMEVLCVSGTPISTGFKDNGDGTVSDLHNELMWQQNLADEMSWEDALIHCEALNLAGYNDWRLPNIKEVIMLTDNLFDAIDSTYFAEGGSGRTLFSSSTDRNGDILHRKDHEGLYRNNHESGEQFHFRCVRGGGAPYFSILSTSPGSGGYIDSADSSISATFNRDINESTVSADSFLVSKDNASVFGSVSCSDKTATFTASDGLSTGSYTATVKSTVEDTKGNTLPDDFSWTFTVSPAFSSIAINSGSVQSMASFNGLLYFGMITGGSGAEVWTYNGTNLVQSGDTALQSSSIEIIEDMAEYDGSLYTCTGGGSGGEVWKYNGTNWVSTSLDLGDTYSLLVDDNKLFAVEYSGKVKEYNGSSWTETSGEIYSSLGPRAEVLSVFANSMYMGLANTPESEIRRYDGTNWNVLDSSGFGDSGNTVITDMASFNSKLFVLVSNSTTGAEVWQYDGTNWIQVNEDGFGNADQAANGALVVFNNALYAGPGRYLYQYESGTTWHQMNQDAFGDSIQSFAEHEGKLYIGLQGSGFIWEMTP